MAMWRLRLLRWLKSLGHSEHGYISLLEVGTLDGLEVVCKFWNVYTSGKSGTLGSAGTLDKFDILNTDCALDTDGSFDTDNIFGRDWTVDIDGPLGKGWRPFIADSDGTMLGIDPTLNWNGIFGWSGILGCT
eukprot:666099_1